jgi:hypothetical protein
VNSEPFWAFRKNENMRSDNKVRELATVCLLCQQWTENSGRFDDVGISAFHSCVVDLWPPVSVWRLLLSVFWCVTNNSWILHDDNASAHTELSVTEFLASKQITLLENPPYSPYLAPNDFFLNLKLKEILKGRHFDDIDDIRNNMTAALKDIPQNQFQNYFQGWTRRWNQCIASQWEYFEGDHSDIQQ